jgi:hypothetical protein
MTQGGKEMMAEQWRCMLGRLDIRDALDQNYSKSSYYFSNLVSEFPLTYMYFIEDGVKELPSPPPFYMTHKPYYTAIHSPSHDITVSQL